MTRHLLMTLAALALLAPVARADAPTVRTVTMTGPATTAISVDQVSPAYELVVTLDLPQGYYENLQVKVMRPDAALSPQASLKSHASPTGWTVATATASVRTFTIPSVDLTTQGASYLFRVFGVFDSYYTKDGTPMTFTVEVTGKEGASSSSTAPFATMTANHTVTATAVTSLAFFPAHFAALRGTIVYPAGATTDAGGNPGVAYTYRVNANLGGGPRSDPGGTLTLSPNGSFSPDITYIGSIPSMELSVQPNGTVTGAPAMWSAPSGPITTTFGYAFFHGPSGGTYGDTAYTLFFPCDALPLDRTAATVDIAAHVTETKWSGTVVPHDITSTLAPSSQIPACGTGGALTLDHWSGVFGGGTRADWRMTLTWPTGIPVITSPMQVLELPPETTALSFGTNASNELWETGFERWSCNFNGLFGGGQFSPADFVANRATRCRQLNGATPGTFMAGDTHLVLYAASTSGLEGTILKSPRWTAYTTVPPDWSTRHGNTITTRAWFNATYELDGTTHTIGDNVVGNTTTDGWERTYSKTLPSFAAPTLSNGGQSDLDANAGQSTLIRTVYVGSGLYPRNPVVTVTVPDGFDVIAIAAPSFAGCPTVPTAITYPALTDRPLVFRFGSDAEPWYQQCDFSNVGITLQAQASYPFVHKELRNVVVRVDADNTNTPYNASSTGTARMLVASGEDAQLTGESCWQGGGTTYRATAVNRGQLDLTNIELRYSVPAGATFVSAALGNVATSGSFEVSTDGGTSWSAYTGSAPSTVTDVRLVGFTIPGLGIDAIRPYFDVTVAPTNVGPVTASAWMSSAELGVAPVVYSEVDPCPGTITVQKFIDRDLDGVRDAGEAAPGAGFVFGLRQGGTVLYQATTDASGLATFVDVLVGDYDVVELGTPTDLTNPGTWTATSSPSLVVDPGASAALEFGNGCACDDPTPDDPCSSAACDDTGTCVTTYADYGTTCVGGFAGGGCSEEICDGAGSCIPHLQDEGTPCPNPEIEMDGECIADTGECGGDGICWPVPVNQGEPCTDSTPDNSCMANACDAGWCVEVAAAYATSCELADQSELENQSNPCVMGEGLEGSCVAVPDPDATTCTLSGSGLEGMVLGLGGHTNPCAEDLGQCVAGMCEEVPVADGTECGDAESALEEPCIDYTCQSGTCTQANAADGESCEPFRVYRGANGLCALHACDAGACVAAGEVDCSDGNTCTNNWCDPSTGQCQLEGPDCTSVPYYAPVVDGSGTVVGAIVCRATPNEGSAPTLACDLEQIPDAMGQQLLVDPAYGDACAGGAP